MATFDISPLFRSTSIDFDRTWDQLHTALHRDSSGYPAYDILRVTDDEFRISLAVPGFTEKELTVETRDGAVWVKGNREIDPNHNQYLYRGIVMQAFQRTFQLPEHVRVQGARLRLGLLHIDLVRELPQALRPRHIEIEQEPSGQSVLQDTSKAA